MKSIISLCIFALSVTAIPAQEKQKSDVKSLQGAWVMVGLEVDGEQVPDAKIENTELQIKGNMYVVKVKDKKHLATIELFPSKKPKAIDMVPQDGPHKDQVLKGIYRFKGDRLQICRGLAMDQERPRAFETTAGSGLFIVTWERKSQ